jgi:hypothetical protein
MRPGSRQRVRLGQRSPACLRQRGEEVRKGSEKGAGSPDGGGKSVRKPGGRGKGPEGSRGGGRGGRMSGRAGERVRKAAGAVEKGAGCPAGKGEGSGRQPGLWKRGPDDRQGRGKVPEGSRGCGKGGRMFGREGERCRKAAGAVEKGAGCSAGKGEVRAEVKLIAG